MDSVWVESAKREECGALEVNKKCDVLIVGGGMAGILCAYMLKKSGVDCILLEAKRLCDGITKNTTTKITLEHGLIYDKLIRRFGFEKAKGYLLAQQDALLEYSRLCKEIDCDYEIKDAYVYSLDDRRVIEREVEAFNRLGLKVEFSMAEALPFEVAGAVRVRGQAQFNPLKFAFEIAKEITVYENTKVLELMPGEAKTQHGSVYFNKVIIATHFPILNKHGAYFVKMYQHRSYVLALDGAADVDGMYVDEDKKGLSLRNYGNLLLLGGGAHRTGKRGGSFKVIEAFAEAHYPKAKIENRWATQDCMTLDGVPYIGQYSRSTPNMYVATGFNKWGMTSSMVAAQILCDLVQERKNEYVPVFSPSRSILHPTLAVNLFETVTGLLTPTAPRCPHLGCALKYNREEHTWDCPCHGSRFTEQGELIDNPATDDKRNM